MPKATGLEGCSSRRRFELPGASFEALALQERPRTRGAVRNYDLGIRGVVTRGAGSLASEVRTLGAPRRARARAWIYPPRLARFALAEPLSSR